MKVATQVIINIPDEVAFENQITEDAVKRALFNALVVEEWPLLYLFEEELGIDIGTIGDEEDPIEVPEGRELVNGAR